MFGAVGLPLVVDADTGYGNAASAYQAVRRLEAAIRASGLPKSEAVRLISEFKSGLSAGGGEGDPTDDGEGDPASTEAAVLAALRGFSIQS